MLTMFEYKKVANDFSCPLLVTYKLATYIKSVTNKARFR